MSVGSEASNAGGLGMLAGARVSPERLQEDIRSVRARTDRPFGVNLLLAPPEPGDSDVVPVQRFLDRFREELGLPFGKTELTLPPSPLSEQLAIVFEARVPVLGTALGDPSELTERAHSEGVLVTSMVTTARRQFAWWRTGLISRLPRGPKPGAMARP